MRELQLTQGKVALVDDEDWDRVSALKWHARFNKKRPHVWYAARRDHKSTKTIYLHRFIVDAPQGADVDHKNGDGLDCRRENLRCATRSQNNMNRKTKPKNRLGIFGVEAMRRSESTTFRARLQVNGKSVHSRTYATLDEAVAARKVLAASHFGEFSE